MFDNCSKKCHFLESILGKRENYNLCRIFKKELYPPKKAKKNLSKEISLQSKSQLAEFLNYYQSFKNPSISKAYKDYAEAKALAGEKALSIDQVRYALRKLPDFIKEKGRKTGSELRKLRTYIKRDWSVLEANDCWVGDGHLLKCKIRNPKNGNPVTAAMDVAIASISDCFAASFIMQA